MERVQLVKDLEGSSLCGDVTNLTGLLGINHSATPSLGESPLGEEGVVARLGAWDSRFCMRGEDLS